MNLENLDSVVDFIVENNLIEKGDHVGVGVSGGADSMCLLHFLNSLKDVLQINIIALNVNHNIRPSAKREQLFVAKFCKQHDIPFVGYSVNVPEYATSAKIGHEQAARVKRYESFVAAVKKFKLTKIALAHHQSDQAETILLHIFRGAGLPGASGMALMRHFKEAELGGFDGRVDLIRPFLTTPKAEIVAYNYRNGVPHVEDESNKDENMARNFIRNSIIPLLQREWRNVEKNIVDFGHNCQTDDEYLDTIANISALHGDANHIKIPLTFFAYPYPIISRVILSAFDHIDAIENIGKKHVDMIINLAAMGENGNRMDLPNNLYAAKEYEYLTVARRLPPEPTKIYPFKIGRTTFADYGQIIVTKTISHKEALKKNLMVVDVDKLPRAAKWRTRREGDIFTKFGGGTKTLNAYLIDCKIPSRVRDRLPVLAHNGEIYAIANLEISDKVKTDRETLEAYVIEFIKD